MQFDNTNKTVSISGAPGEKPIVIAMGEILKAEARQQEIACVTPEKAPELLQVYNQAWRNLHKIFCTLVFEKKKAEAAVTKRKSVVILEVVEPRLKELNIKSTADTRLAVLDLDQEYVDCLDYLSQTEALAEYIKGKLRSFENAFSSVKKIMQEDAYNMLYKGNDGTSGDTGSAPAGSVNKSGFGNPKY